MAIELTCPSCQQRLSVSDESAGKGARCPSCGTITPIPAAPLPAAPPSPFSDSLTQSSSPFAPTRSSSNPYAPPQLSSYEGKEAFRAQDGPIDNQVVGIEPILNHAWEVWKRNLGLLVGVTVAVALVNFVLSMALDFATMAIRQNDAEEAAVALSILGNLAANALSIFLGIGQAQIALKLARGQPATFEELFSGGPRFLPVLGFSILGGIALVIGFLLLIIPGIFLLIIFWPSYYLVVEGRTGVIESFSVASNITRQNWGTTFLVWLLSVAITIVGVLALCIGVFFAAPLVSMLWATAYLMMSGQLSPYPQPSKAY